MLFDTHVHLNAEQFEDDLSEVIERAIEAGVERMVVVGFDRPTIEKAMELIETYDFIYASVGWHPVDAIDMTDEEDNPDSYDVRLYGKHFEGEVLYDENYNVVSYKEEVTDTRLPDNVVNAIETKYPDSRFTKDVEIISDDQNFTDEYKVYFINGKKRGFALVYADGKIIRSRK